MTRIAPALLLLAACSGSQNTPLVGDGGDGGSDAGAPTAAPPRVIVFIGDGMGPVHEQLTSRFVYGSADSLAMQQLPARGELLTASPSGITDSAAAATAMATGALTYNDRVAVDRDYAEVATILETAAGCGLATGVVTTASLPHGTPAAFTAHDLDRANLAAIAAEQIAAGTADVLLGGGAQYYSDTGDYTAVTDAASLEAIDPGEVDRLFGAFAADHLPYVLTRAPSMPGLEAMTAKAIEILERDPDGFVLVVEAARIDHGSHSNLIGVVLHETAELDRAIAATVDWASGRDNVSIIATADHETGGLEAQSSAGAGELPQVSWRWGEHSNRRVNLRASGPIAAAVDGGLFDPRIVYQLALAAITGVAVREPQPLPIASGHTGELQIDGASQSVVASGAIQIDRLRVDTDDYGLIIGVEGLYSFAEGALVVLIDADFGAATGPAVLTALPDVFFDPLDRFVTRLAVDGTAIAGFGIDAAAISIRGIESNLTGGLTADAGFRKIDPFGVPDASVGGVAILYDDGVRQQIAAPFSGAELHIPWDRLYPSGVPSGEIAIAALLTDASGAAVTDQALPAWLTPGVLESVVVVQP